MLKFLLADDRILNVGNASRLLHQAPQSRPHRIESVVSAALHVEDRDFPSEIISHLAFQGHNDGAIGNRRSQILVL